jgi:hypothetical protein
MQGVGFVDETDPAEVDRIVATVRRSCAALTPFPLTIGPPVVTAEAITMPATPLEPIRRVRAAVRAGIAEVWGVDNVPEDADGFRPHVSLAYSNGDGPAAPYIDAVEHGHKMTAQVTISHADLIVLNRDNRCYQWATSARVALGA